VFKNKKMSTKSPSPYQPQQGAGESAYAALAQMEDGKGSPKKADGKTDTTGFDMVSMHHTGTATIIQGTVLAEINETSGKASTKSKTNNTDDDDEDETIYYSGYIWKSNSTKNNSSSCKLPEDMVSCCKGTRSWMVMLCVLCPLMWFTATTFINIFEVVVWNFSFPGVLWFVYLISTVSALLDFFINCIILYHCNTDTKKTDSKIVSFSAVTHVPAATSSARTTTNPTDSESKMKPRKFSAFLGACCFNDKRYWFDLDRMALAMMVDFTLVVISLATCLMPIMLKGSMQPDDALNTTFEQMSTNMFDLFAILALTASNMVLNKLVGSVVRQAVIQHRLYMEDHIFGPDPATNLEQKSARTKVKEKRMQEARNVFQSLQGKAARRLEHADKTVREGAIETMTLIDKFVFEMDSKTSTGKFRSYLRMKMLLNLSSVTLFAFYANIYLSAGEGSYVFVLFIAVLSFLNNLTSAAAIKKHDCAVNRVFGDELKLSIGDSHGFNNIQYYYSVGLSLVNLIIRAKVAA
jgi:hypothetical protein